MKVLIVEDNPGDVRLLQEALKKSDPGEFELTHDSALEPALKRLSTEKFDVILLDLSLPQFFGLVPLTEVREVAPKTPVFVLSGYNDPDLCIQAIKAGAKNYIVKNHFEVGALVEMLRSADGTARPSAPAPAAPPPRAPEKKSEAPGGKKRIVGRAIEILHVEDNREDTVLMKEIFKHAGFPHNISVVKDGEEAISFLTQHGPYSESPRPDVILLDLKLPKKDGWTVLKEIRQDEKLASIPVFILTHSEDELNREWAQRFTNSFYFVKPLDLEPFKVLVDPLRKIWMKTFHNIATS